MEILQNEINEITYQTELPSHFISTAVNLYHEAFENQLKVAIKSYHSRKLILNSYFMFRSGIIAQSEGELIGIACIYAQNSLLARGLTYTKLISQLGFIQGNWAAFIFSLYRRKPVLGELVIDGIVVRSDARGQGIGSRLLEEVKNYAKVHKFSCIRLDVIDMNSKAKRLYERKGFKSLNSECFPYLKWLLGFGGYTTMELTIYS